MTRNSQAPRRRVSNLMAGDTFFWTNRVVTFVRAVEHGTRPNGDKFRQLVVVCDGAEKELWYRDNESVELFEARRTTDESVSVSAFLDVLIGALEIYECDNSHVPRSIKLNAATIANIARHEHIAGRVNFAIAGIPVEADNAIDPQRWEFVA